MCVHAPSWVAVAGSPGCEDEATEANCFVVLLKDDECEFFASVCGWKSQVLKPCCCYKGLLLQFVCVIFFEQCGLLRTFEPNTLKKQNKAKK